MAERRKMELIRLKFYWNSKLRLLALQSHTTLLEIKQVLIRIYPNCHITENV